jgi:alkanesulfonate monooxygenase SsuD/methylene tetrahydromethanopterin reductase-like flavin-dependent oxidoreductase (luciferase family)
MDHGLWLHAGAETDATSLVEWAVAAEAAGWDGVFVSDSLPFTEYPDPWVVLAGMATRTTELTLGTWVVPVPRRQPWQVAQEVATLDRLADGRLLLGVGLGNDVDYEAFGEPYDPPALGTRLDEALEVVTGLWEGEPFSYDGEVFTLADAEVQPTPVQEPRVPILAGCWWPNEKPFHRGARWDGIMPYFPSLTGEEAGPRGETTGDSPVDELRDALAFYHEIADDPGEVVVPTVPSMAYPAYVELCADLGATWVLTTDLGDGPAAIRETIRAGPPV